MPITYDLETDIRYLQGVEKAKMDLIKDFVKGNELTNAMIAKYFKVPIEEIERIKNDMELDTGSPEEVQGQTGTEEKSDKFQ